MREVGVKKLISIVIPCFNEEEVIGPLINEINAFCLDSPRYRHEIIFVDDGSKDNTLKLLTEAASKNQTFKVFSFSRNFGHQIAISAGVDVAAGDALVFIDADLQDPPQVITNMLKQWEQGAEVVYAVRTSREGESPFKLSTAKHFYRILNWFSDIEIPPDTGDFRLIDRRVADVLKKMPERHRFVRGMVAWIGFRQVALPYVRKKRYAGSSKYPLGKMLRFAIDGILSFSSKPLELAVFFGMLACSLSVLGIIYAILMRIFTSTWVEGWTALMIAVLFLGGFQLFFIGIIGAYVGRIYEESKNRPLYILRDDPDREDWSV
jgi:polyisoprenyl-phosphate glycosyltransferase